MADKEIEYELIDTLEVENKRYAIIAEKGKEDEAFVMFIKEKNSEKDLVPVNDDAEFEKVMAEYEKRFEASEDEIEELDELEELDKLDDIEAGDPEEHMDEL